MYNLIDKFYITYVFLSLKSNKVQKLLLPKRLKIKLNRLSNTGYVDGVIERSN